MTVIRAGARPTKQAPAANFTGVVWQDEVIVGKPPSRMRATMVTFTPGARTAWHSHPVGQVLWCVSGIGRVCLKGEPPRVLHPGDTAIIPPDTWHWHGAAPDRLFAHLAMSETGADGQGTSWFEPVADVDYRATPAD